MKPILFPASATTFTTNGLGRLGATECFVERQVNGYDDLTMVVPVDDRRYGEISISKIVLAKPSNAKNNQAYRIYKISKPINGLVEVYAHHISYQLSYIPVMPYTATSCADALNKIPTNAAESCPFTFSTNKTITANWSSPDVPTSARAILQGQQGSILQRFKGEFEYDNWNVALKTRIGTDNGVVIRYGKNLTDLKQEESIENTYTGICPFYKSDDYVLTLPEKVLHSANASNFPYQRTLPVDLSSKFSEIPTVQQLRDAGNAYITENNIGIPKVSLEVSFIPLSDTEDYKGHSLESVELGDTVGVYFEKLGVEASAEVVYTKYNVLAERYDKIQIGSVKSSFSDTVAKQQEEIQIQKTNFEQAVQTATELINGGLGGYVRTTTNSAGQPQEILIMDTDDTATATNVIRMNQNGIGFSTTGYQGPFNSAWTIDGTFDASVINVINLIAHKLTTENSLSDTKIEMDDGAMVLYRKISGTWAEVLRIGRTGSNFGRIYMQSPDSSRTLELTLSGCTFDGMMATFSNLWISATGSLNFSNGGKLMSKSPSWVGSGKGYLLAGDDIDVAPMALQNLKEITENADLNDVITCGAYCVRLDRIAQTLTNIPENGAGVLVVYSIVGTTGGATTGRYLRQRFYPLSGFRTYERQGTTGSSTSYTWTEWVQINGLKKLNSDVTLPVSSGTVVLSEAQKYTKLMVVGRPSSSTVRVSSTIPVDMITTSNTRWQINDEANYLSFDVKKVGTSFIHITIANNPSNGSILGIYGEV